MYDMYIPNEKFDSIKISVLRDVKNIFKKMNHIQDVKDFFP